MNTTGHICPSLTYLFSVFLVSAFALLCMQVHDSVVACYLMEELSLRLLPKENAKT